MFYSNGQQGYNRSKGTQDWQLEAYEMKSKRNSITRHQRVINEMENGIWERKRTTIIR